jgi:endonuclease YncB( thermonuclease family)
MLLTLSALAGEVRITDGDTLKLKGTTWRLWGIDAPEDGQRCTRGGAPYDCGDEATAALVRIIGDAVPLCRRKDTDRYGRTVGQCYVDGQDVGALLVRAGWAVDYERYSDGHYADQENEARENKRGMWAGEFIPPWEWRRSGR